MSQAVEALMVEGKEKVHARANAQGHLQPAGLEVWRCMAAKPAFVEELKGWQTA